MKTILNFIEGIIKEYGITALMAFVTGVATVTIVPKEKVDILPFGKQNIYWALITAIVAWIIIINLVKSVGIKFWSNIKEGARKNNSYIRQQNKQQLHEYIDTLSQRDRDILYRFLDTNNAPIPFGGCGGYMDDGSIFYSNLIDMTEKRTKEEVSFLQPETNKKTTGYVYHTHVAKLKPQVYEMLKALREEDGRLGNFD